MVSIVVYEILDCNFWRLFFNFNLEFQMTRELIKIYLMQDLVYNDVDWLDKSNVKN